MNFLSLFGIELNKVRSFRAGVFGTLVLLALVIAGCTGDTDGGSAADEDFAGTQFVDTDDAAGSIRLEVNDEEVAVSQTSGFRVTVRDANSGPVENVAISCDTEDGLALLEPTSGVEHTDSSGGMSGVVGCEAPGSFRIGCRLPIGANKRQFKTIKCAGPVPAGFDGFDGAGGGGLGGGVDIDDDGGVGGTDTDGVRLASIFFVDTGDLGGGQTTSLDVIQGVCGTDCDDPDSTCTAEPFFDSYIGVSVINNTNQTITFRSLIYSVPEALGSGTATITSKTLKLIGNGVIDPDGSTDTFVTLMLDAGSGTKSYFAENTAAIPSGLGFRNVRVTLIGTNESGDSIRISGSTAVSIDNFNRCDS